jgi:subfamily B ATP-binding cassette protein MsbA
MIKRLLSKVDRRIADELYDQRRTIILGLTCSTVVAALGGVMVWFIKLVVKAVEDGDADRLSLLSLAVIGIFLVKYWFTRGQTYYLSRAANRMTANLRLKLFAKLQRLPVSYFNQRRAGSIQSVLTNDVGVYQSAVTLVKDAIDGPIKVVAGLVTIFLLQWKLAAVSILVLPVLAYVIQRNARKMKQAQADVQQDLANMTSNMQESLQGIRVIQAFGAEEDAKQRFERLVNTSFDSQMRAVKRVATLKPMVELIGAVGIALVVLMCGYLVRRGEIVVNELAAFLFALDYINQGFRNLGALRQTTAQVSAAADRIYQEVLMAPEPLADAPDAQELPTFSGCVEFRNVSFAYPDGTEALSNVSFVLEPGTSLALVGPSGAGKSTIADLVLRYADPTSGQVLFDGVDVRELKTEWLRKQIGVVPQQTFLFAGSVADNLRMSEPTATDEQIYEALRAAHAGFVDALPDGIHSETGERGVRLSGGEGQRLAIARAFIRKPRLLVLDEATSNLDSVSERAVQQALAEIMPGRTSLYIVHRLATAARADRILVLRRGQLVESGTYAELIAQNGLFASMVKAMGDGPI